MSLRIFVSRTPSDLVHVKFTSSRMKNSEGKLIVFNEFYLEPSEARSLLKQLYRAERKGQAR